MRNFSSGLLAWCAEMRWFWCALFCLTGFWIAHPGWLAGGLIFGALACRRMPIEQTRTLPSLALALTLGLVSWLCPGIWSVPPALIGLGCLSLVAGLLRLSQACLFSGLMLSAQSLVAAGSPILLARRHELPLGSLLEAVYRLLGLDAASNGAAIAVLRTVATVRLENLMAPALLLLAVGGGIGLWLSGRRRLRCHLAWLSYLALFGLIRLTAQILLHPQDLPPGLGLLSLLPLIIPLAWLDRAQLVRPRLDGATKPAWAFAAGLLLLAMAWHLPDPGTPKQGRILIDESHSRWEPVAVPLDTRSYGLRTVYTYWSLSRSLGRHFGHVSTTRGTIDDRELARCDVLILKTPTRPYTPAEVAAIVRFVRRGGGLWMIGEHTNVFGSSTHLNPVAEQFGIRYRHDAVLARGSQRPKHRRPAWFAHPTVNHMRPMLDAISCSLVVRGRVRTPLVADTRISAGPDWSSRNFFGPFQSMPHQAKGRLVQMAAHRFGRGRVVAFTDSTLFSSFCYHLPGIEDLALGTVDWLNRRASSPWGWLAIGTLGLVLVLWSLSRQPGVLLIAAAGWIAIASASIGHHLTLRQAYPAPTPHTPGVQVGLLQSERYQLSLKPTPDQRPNLLTFVVALQRLGLVPRFGQSVAQLEKCPVIIQVGPPTEHTALTRHLEGGGQLLILLDTDEQTPLENRPGVVVSRALGELRTQHLGATGDRPGPEERRRYEMIYRLFIDQLGVGKR